jgi:hypothetical protein
MVMVQTEIPQLGGPRGPIESVHMLLRSVELSADEALATLVEVRAEFDSRTVEAQQEAFTIRGMTPEQFDARYSFVL